MKISRYMPLLLVSLTLTAGCSIAPVGDVTSSYSAPEPAADSIGSLFASDRAVLSDDAVRRALDAALSMPDNARIALLDMSPSKQGVRYYGWAYWRSEEYMNQQQRYFDALAAPLLAEAAVSRVVPMPAFTVNSDMSLSQIREAAVRMQIDTLVIYSARSDIFEKHRFLKAAEVKGYATCEVAIFDTRSGLMPFTNVVTEKQLVTHDRAEEQMQETRMRAELQATEQCLTRLGASLAAYTRLH